MRFLIDLENQLPIETEGVLTDVMLLRLATKFSSPKDIHTLAERGLGMDVSEVNTCFYNERTDINMAMHAVLQKWRVTMQDSKTAYACLCKALVTVDMRYLIKHLK